MHIILPSMAINAEYNSILHTFNNDVNVLENIINVVIAQIDLRNIIYQIMNDDSATKV